MKPDTATPLRRAAAILLAQTSPSTPDGFVADLLREIAADHYPDSDMRCVTCHPTATGWPCGTYAAAAQVAADVLDS